MIYIYLTLQYLHQLDNNKDPFVSRIFISRSNLVNLVFSMVVRQPSGPGSDASAQRLPTTARLAQSSDRASDS